MAEVKDDPSAIVVGQVPDRSELIVAPCTYLGVGLCISIGTAHDDDVAVLTPAGARSMAEALLKIADRVEAARKVLAGRP